jgi:hypothetical protein
MRCLQLPFRFDPGKLRADLALIAPAEWIPHLQRRHYDGQWSGAPLRSPGGATHSIVPESLDGAAFADTPLLARCAYFQEVLATFRCPLLAVRLLRLHAGSHIAEHVDHALEFEQGQVRIHIPIVTSDDVKFFLDGMRLAMAPGEAWYTNVNLPHSVENHGTIDRIHLVLDCSVDGWLRELFARASNSSLPEGHAARLRATTPIAVPALLTALQHHADALRAPDRPHPRPVRFFTAGGNLVLQWRAKHAWQIRMQHRAAAGAETLTLETSPDPTQEHRAKFDALIACLRRALPGLEVDGAAAP